MRYYNSIITNKVSDLSMIILPWGNKNYEQLHMGVISYPDILK